MIQTTSETFDILWFELELRPRVFRFAIIPGQPGLVGIGVQLEGGPAPSTTLMPIDQFGDAIERLLSDLSVLVKQIGIWETPENQPELCFAPGRSDLKSLHLRMATLTENRQWYFTRDDAPAPFLALLNYCWTAALSVANTPAVTVSMDQARSMLQSDSVPESRS